MNLLKVYLVFYGLLLFHELGHFLAAKALHVKVESFRIGAFKIAGTRVGNTKFELGILPVIGYVIPDEESHEAMNTLGKVILSLSGPFASALAGFIFLALSGMHIGQAAFTSALMPAVVPFLLLLNPDIFAVTNDANNVAGASTLAESLSGTGNETLEYIGLLSLAIAGLNLLPIPPLDGGQVVFDILEAIFGKRKVARLEVNGEAPSVVSVVRGAFTAVFLLYIAYVVIAEIWFLIF